MSLKQLLRPRINSQLGNVRYYHPSNAGRALMGSTEVQEPPKHYFLYIYHYDTQPDALCGVRYPKYQAFVRYDGEWWDIGSLSCNLLWFLGPLLFYIFRTIEDANAKESRATQTKIYYTTNGFGHMGFSEFFDDPLE